MAIDVFAKKWGSAPGLSDGAITGHPLCPNFGFVCNDGLVRDIVRNVQATWAAGDWAPTTSRGYPTKGRKHTATSDTTTLGLTALLLPLANCTLVLGYQKTDGTNRNSAAIGNNSGVNAGECDCLIPFGDGTVYWDWGGSAGGQRVSVAGLTFGDDVWVFTVGPREQAIYQNGISRASNGNNATRTDQAADTLLFGKLGATTSDLALYKFLWIYHRQLSVREIVDISAQPYQWVSPRP